MPSAAMSPDPACLLSRALVDDRLSVQMLAMKVIDNRLLGRPQATEPTHGSVTVIFTAGKYGGLDPSKLPGASSKPALPKAGDGKVVLPTPHQRTVDVPRHGPEDSEES